MAFSNSQYNAIMREYERIREKNRKEQDRRLERVYAVIPQIKELQEKPSILALEYFEKSKYDKSALDDFRKRIEEIKKLKNDLLKEYGFPDNYMEEIFECKLCKDSGMIENKRCNCFNKKLLEQLYKSSNLKNIFNDENFKNFSLDYFDDTKPITKNGLTHRQYNKKIKDICENFVKNFDKKKDNILFIGDTGVGKSFLSNCIAKKLIESYHSVIYLSSEKLFNILDERRIKRFNLDCEDYLDDYIDNCELLIIDDLGTESNSNNTQIFNLLNERFDNNKATIISTNLSPAAIREMYTERVSSRILNLYTVLKLYGDDIREKKKEKNN